MKINPDDPWYPNPFKCNENNGIGCPVCNGVTIRLKLAAEMMKSPDWFAVWFGDVSPENVEIDDFINGVLRTADAMIERVNNDEGSDDGK